MRDDGVAKGFLSIRNRYRIFAQPADWEQHEQIESRYLEQERTRLLYVAATRARDTLVISRWAGTHRGPVRPWQTFEPFLDDVEEFVTIEEERADPAPPKISLAQANAAGLERSARWAEL